MRTRWSASAASSAGRPQASLPKSQAVGAGEQVAGAVQVDLAGAVGGQDRQPGCAGRGDGARHDRPRRPRAGGRRCRRWRAGSWGCRGRPTSRPARRRRRRRRRRCGSTVPALPGSRTSAQIATSRGDRVEHVLERPVDEAAQRHDAGGVDRVAQRGQRPLVDEGDLGVPGRVRGTAPAGVAKTSTTHPGTPQRALDGLRAVGKEQPPLGSLRAAAELADVLEAGVAHREGHDVQAVASVVSRGALTSAGSAALAVSTSALNAATSLTARSARILRSTSTPARLRPWMKRL